jgi:SAM-dependent methyltransferase
MAVDFERERHWWDAKAPREDQDGADERVNRALRWRVIERHLDGVQTILDVGGGTGAFSIPLAKRGYRVTHLDLSPAMLEIARKKAEGVANIEFVEGNATDLSRFADRSFGLVLNMDGAISFAGSEHQRAIEESCRVTRRRLIVTVSHRAWMVVAWLQASLAVSEQILPAVYEMAEQGSWHQDRHPENALMSRGCTQDYFGAFQAFLPSELRALLERAGMRVLRCSGLGSLANFVGEKALARATQNETLSNEFLDLCERFDSEIMPDGPGTTQRAGLIAVAER